MSGLEGAGGVPVAQEAREALEGALTAYPKHPDMDDTYYINGAWAPACITAQDKRFTDAELAAEYWRHDGDTSAVYEGLRVETWGGEAGTGDAAEKVMKHRLETLEQLATIPHHDQETA